MNMTKQRVGLRTHPTIRLPRDFEELLKLLNANLFGTSN
jgi:hypothetical protein